MSVAPPTVIVGDYVVRKYDITDAQALVDAVTESCEHLRPWMPWITFEPQTVAQRETLIETWSDSWDARTEFVMGILLDDRVVGGTGFHLRGAENTVEIGYWVHADFIGQGIATQVAGALTDVAFAIWQEIDTVEIHHDEANIRSSGVPKKLQFELVETFPRVPEASGEIGILLRWVKRRS